MDEQLLSIFLVEYSALKSEQNARIGFRDNLLYVTLGLFGGIMSFALTNEDGAIALLVIPWVCLVLGWTYIVNDEKISSSGDYIRTVLSKQIAKHIDPSSDVDFFGWERFHKIDARRIDRKRKQLLVDQMAFVLSGIIAISLFWIRKPDPNLLNIFISGVEFICLVHLGLEIKSYTRIT